MEQTINQMKLCTEMIPPGATRQARKLSCALKSKSHLTQTDFCCMFCSEQDFTSHLMVDNLETFRCAIFVFYHHRHYSISKKLNSWSSLLTWVTWTESLWHSQEPQATASPFTYTPSKPSPLERQAYSVSHSVLVNEAPAPRFASVVGWPFLVLVWLWGVFFVWGSLVGIFCFLLVWGLFGVFLKKKKNTYAAWSPEAYEELWYRIFQGTYEIGEAQSIREFTFYSILVTKPLVASLVTSNTRCLTRAVYRLFYISSAGRC